MTPDSPMAELEEPLASFLDRTQLTVCAPGLRPEEAPVYDFQNPVPAGPPEMHKLRAHQEQFVQNASTRLSIHLGLDFLLKLTGVKTCSYEKLAEGWGRPAHLTLFKMEPLRGVSILEISSHLALSVVDRLMGGPGHVPPTDQEISEIENVLLEQSVQLILNEWCDRWSSVKELKPVILGYESNGAFIQSTPPETIMLVVSMKAGFAGGTGEMQMAFPHAVLEPLIRRVCKGAEATASPVPAAPPNPAPSWKWNSCFDNVCVPVKAEWEGLELTARQILALKVGDVLPLQSPLAQQINVRVADLLKFQGRPGTVAGQWAVELTQVINR